MSSHQSLRWVLTESEARRLAWDPVADVRFWDRPVPWFVRWRRAQKRAAWSIPA